MARDIDEPLGSFAEDDYTTRLCRSICAVVPFGPALQHYGSMAEAVKQLEPLAKRPTLDRAKELASGPEAQSALWLADAVDTADSGLSVFSGVKSAVGLYRSGQGERLQALETDTQQMADAVLKALAVSSIVYKVFPGTPLEKVQAFRALPSGQALALYFATVELGLPFTDNVVSGGGNVLGMLYAKLGPDQANRLRAVAGDEAATGAAQVMEELVPAFDSIARTAAGHINAIAEAASRYLPGALDVGDKAAGLVATGADVLPVYRYLGTRVVAEACARRALAEVPPVPEVNDNPALDGVKYTTKKPDRDEIVVPQARKRGFCLLFVALFAASSAAGLGTLGAAFRWMLA